MPGFIRISRDLFDDPTFASVRFPRPWALIDLVQLARYKQGSEYVNGRVVSLERGQLCKSIRWLATRWRWDEKTVQSFIRSLIIGGVITYEFPQSNKGVTGIISIVNYDNFVGDSYTPSHTTSHTTSDTLYKEIKNKEEKKVSKDTKEKIEFPFSSEKFMSTWNILVKQPKWKGKTVSALQFSLNKLAKYDEEFAIRLMEDSIANNYQGVVFPKTEKEYAAWKATKQPTTRPDQVKGPSEIDKLMNYAKKK